MLPYGHTYKLAQNQAAEQRAGPTDFGLPPAGKPSENYHQRIHLGKPSAAPDNSRSKAYDHRNEGRHGENAEP